MVKIRKAMVKFSFAIDFRLAYLCKKEMFRKTEELQICSN